MTPARRRLVVAGSLAVLVLLAGATGWKPLSAWLASPPPEKMTFAVSTAYIGSGLVHVAAAKGCFTAEGIEASLQPHTSGRSALDAVMAGRADLATVGDTPVMFAVLRKNPVAIVTTIATVVQSHGIVARRDRGINAPADLRGKSVGATFGTDAHFLLSVILTASGTPPESVRAVSMKPEEVVHALVSGQVDAVATWDPWLTGARKAAGRNAVPMFADSGFAFWFHLVGRRETIARNPEAAKKVLRALLCAERVLEDEPEAAQDIVMRATGIDHALFAQSWPKYTLQLKLHQGLLTMLEDQARWAMANGYADASAMPNFLEAVYLDAMLSVRPESVSIVR